jgi:hypothetical protein
MCKDNTTVGGITLYVEDKGGSSLCIWTYTCAEREILYNTYQEMAIWKSIVSLIYKEFYLPLWKFETHQDRKITSQKLNKIYNSDRNVDR